MLADGVVIERHEGTPQGGPLSPLLANVLLDEIDKELERRGHAFVRYADDLNVYVRSQKAGERVMTSLRKLFARLKLRVNEAKSKVRRATESKFLGFSFWIAAGRTIRRRVAPQALARMKEQVRAMTRRSAGKSLAAAVRETRHLSDGMEGILPDRRDAPSPRRHRRMDTPPAPGGAAQALEARPNDLPRAGCSRDVERGCQAGCSQWPALVAQLAMALHIALPNTLFDNAGSPSTCQLTSTLEPPGADPHAGWCGRGRGDHSAPLCRSPAAARCGKLYGPILAQETSIESSRVIDSFLRTVKACPLSSLSSVYRAEKAGADIG